jgi:hypothetical protein
MFTRKTCLMTRRNFCSTCSAIGMCGEFFVPLTRQINFQRVTTFFKNTVIANDFNSFTTLFHVGISVAKGSQRVSRP